MTERDVTLEAVLAETLGASDSGSGPVPREQILELVERLERLLDAIDTDGLTASPSTRLRVEGAIVALLSLVGDSDPDIPGIR